MYRLLSYILCFCCCALGSSAQFAPQVGQAGSTAIAAGSPLFVNWASSCTVKRGYQNIAQAALGYATAGDSSAAIGMPDFMTVSLGDSGMAILRFPSPIVDGPGPDFAVFENGFIDNADSNFAYLELAFVEVSSDGINFFRFPACSYTPDTAQISNTTFMDCRFINNLAGKYIGGFGTPFDLAELAGIPGLDIQNIIMVRLVDVIGNITEPSSVDTGNRKINDPYPTPFPSSGFDLDAVGVLHQAPLQLNQVEPCSAFSVYPNPTSGLVKIRFSEPTSEGTILLYNSRGALINKQSMQGPAFSVDLSNYPSGLYFISFISNNGQQWVQRLTVL